MHQQSTSTSANAGTDNPRSANFASHVIITKLPDGKRGAYDATIRFDGNNFRIELDDGTPMIDIPRSDIRTYTNAAQFQEFVQFVLHLRGRRSVVINFNDGQKTKEQLGSEIALLDKSLALSGVHQKTIFRAAAYVLFGFLTLLIKGVPVVGLVGIAGLLYLIVTSIKRR